MAELVPAVNLAREGSTESMLREIERHTGDELAMAVRYINHPPGPTFIDALDKLLKEGRPHSGSSTLQRGDLVELVGASGTGKTTLLIFILLTYLLPPTLPDLLSTPIGGRGLHATLIQPKHQRSMVPLLRASMKHHLSSVLSSVGSSMSLTKSMAASMNKAQDQMIERVINDSLARLRIYRPKNRWKDIALCLRALVDRAQPYSSGSQSSHDDAEGVDLLVIDGIGDPHYPYRWSEEQRQASRKPTAGSGRVVGADEVGMKEVMEGIGRVRRELGATVFISRQGLRTNRETQPFFLPHLPSPYPAPFAPPPTASNFNSAVQRHDPAYWPVNVQLTLTGRARGLQYPGETTLTDVLRIKRAQLATRGGGPGQGQGQGHGQSYEGIVRMEGGQGLVGHRGGARFGLEIGPEGLRVWNEGE